jgi:hypothetical protein
MINETWGLGEPPCYMGQIVHPSIMWMHRQLWMRASIKGRAFRSYGSVGLQHRKSDEQHLVRERMRLLMVRRYLSSVAHLAGHS